MTEHENQKSNVYTLNFENEPKLLHLYSLKDVKTGLFLPPSFAYSDDEAIRQCSSIVNFSNSLVCKFPQDYQLYFVGTFSENTGIIVSVTPELICDCISLKTSQSVQFEDLSKEVTSQIQQLVSELKDFERLKHEARSLILKLEDNAHKSEQAIELYKPISPADDKKAKKTIVDFLFKK